MGRQYVRMEFVVEGDAEVWIVHEPATPSVTGVLEAIDRCKERFSRHILDNAEFVAAALREATDAVR